MTMIEVVAILDDGTVEQYRVDAKRLVFESTPEELAAREAKEAAREAFIDELTGLLARHGTRLRSDFYDGWPYFCGPFGEVQLTEWWDYGE